MLNVELTISEDRMQAILVVPREECISLAELKDLITEMGICYGIDVAGVQQAAVPVAFERKVIIARGLAPQKAFYGTIIPPLLEQLPMHVCEGQGLGEFVPPHPERSGWTVLGEELHAEETHLNIHKDVRIGYGLTFDGEGSVHALDEGYCYQQADGSLVVDKVGQRLQADDVQCTISADGMEASIHLPALAMIEMDQLRLLIQQVGIRFGLDPLVLHTVARIDGADRDIVIAHGQIPERGEDAHIEYPIASRHDRMQQPEEEAFGGVDFQELKQFIEVVQETCLLEYIPETLGKVGMTVVGEEIAAEPGAGQDLLCLCGEGTMADPADSNRCLAKIDGIYVCDKFGVVSVSPLLLISGDVDYESGNIDTEYAVHITGDIKKGFSVKSRSDIHVGGVIEDARVSAWGDVVVKNGILAGEHRVKAHGNVLASYTNHREVKGHNIHIEKSIRGGLILATGSVRASRISGCEILAAESVYCDVLGSHIGNDTSVHVGIDPQARSELSDLQKRMSDLEPGMKREAERTKLCRVHYERAKQAFGEQRNPSTENDMQASASEYRRAKRMLAGLAEEWKQAQVTMESLQKRLHEKRDKAVVAVTKTVHQQVTVRISDYYNITTQDELSASVFGGDTDESSC